MTTLDEILLSDEMVCIKRNQERAAQILKALEGLEIREAQQLLGECKLSLNQTKVQLTGTSKEEINVKVSFSPKAEEQKPAVPSQEEEGKIKVLYKRPGEMMHSVRIKNTQKAMQDAVGGYIETVAIAPNCAVICNEKARLFDLAHNCVIHGTPFAGPILIAGVDGDNFCDVPMSVRSMLMGYMGRC